MPELQRDGEYELFEGEHRYHVQIVRIVPARPPSNQRGIYFMYLDHPGNARGYRPENDFQEAASEW